MKITVSLIEEGSWVISYNLASFHLLFPDLFLKMWFLLFFSVMREEFPFWITSFPTPLILILEMFLVLIPDLSHNFIIILVASYLILWSSSYFVKIFIYPQNSFPFFSVL